LAQHVLAYGSKEQKRPCLSRTASGRLVGAFSMNVAGVRPNRQVIATLAFRDENQSVINLGQRAARVAKEPVMSVHE
jgi:alkylation response protein AidB-like acyl-CoA dehydrogenase